MHRNKILSPKRAAGKWILFLAVATAAIIGSGAQASDWTTFLGPRGDGRSDETGLSTVWPPSGLPVVWYRVIGEGYSAPSVSQGRLFNFDRVNGRARLSSFESRTGREIWSRDYASDYRDYYDYSNGPRTSPVVDGDRVYTFGVEGRLRCH